jgi:hypothetical protein
MKQVDDPRLPPRPVAPGPAREPLRAERHRLRPPEEYPGDDDGNDRLRIPRNEYPEGFDLQFVTTKVFGQPVPTHRASFERKGWEPVHASDFQGQFDGRFLPEGHQGEIEVDGLVLMARPQSWSDQAKRRDQQDANDKIAIKERQIHGGDLPQGTSRTSRNVRVTLDTHHPTAVRGNTIRKEISTIAVPDNE